MPPDLLLPPKVERAIIEGADVVTVPGLFYSSRPRLLTVTSGADYFVKGPEPEIVLAEHLAYTLAEFVDLATPAHALVRMADGSLLFGSCAAQHRFVTDVMLDAGFVDNIELIAECAAFDIWIANDDRHVQQFVGRDMGARDGPAQVELLAIDFEKAKALRGESEITLAARNARDFLPRSPLRERVLAAPRPVAMCARIEAVTEETVERIIRRYAAATGAEVQVERIVYSLTSRGRRIRRLVEEALA